MNQENKYVTCDLIKDLLPLYVDDVCSEESQKVISNHLNECVGCKTYLEKMEKLEIEEMLKKDTGQIIARHKRKIKSQMVGIASLCVIVTLLIVTLGWIVYHTGDSVSQEYFTIQTSEYGKWDGHIDLEKKSINSGLYLFPEDISSALDSTYLYYCAVDNNSTSQYLIYTTVTYSENDYEKEINRIANVNCKVKMSLEGKTVTNDVMYSETLFAYPAYVTIYASNHCYEYALIDEYKKEIIYVYLQMKDGNGIIPQEHLPLETLNKDMYINNSWDNKNIYFSKDNNGDYTYYKDNIGS